MKRKFLKFVVAIALVVTGCQPKYTDTAKEEQSNNKTILVRIYCDNGFCYFYDKKTKVMYCKWWSGNDANMFMLMDSTGKPRLYDPQKFYNYGN